MRIIGLAGKARSGKDTVAGMIQDTLELDFQELAVKYALAGPLKEAAAKMFGIHLDDFYNDNKETPNDFWGISPREIAQKFGTECAREVFREDFWLKRMEMEMTSTNCDVFVITDIRFRNEADWVRSHGGEIWHVVRPSIGDGVVRDHASEAGIEFVEGDVSISNDGSLPQLEKRVLTFLDNILTKTKISDSLSVEKENK